MPRFLLTFLLLIPFAGLLPAEEKATRLPPAPPLKVEWKPEYSAGRAYVPVEQVAAYYDLSPPDRVTGEITLRNQTFRIDLETGERKVRLNGWAFYFSFPVIRIKDRPMISVFDVRNVLDPILRPNDRRDPAVLRTVIIDAAWGGKETGIKSPYITEKDLTLEVAKYFKLLLQQAGYQVVMTRDTDKLVSMGMRMRLANDVNEEAIFVSLRAASSSSPKVRGFECATMPPAGSPATNEPVSNEPDKRFFPGNVSDRESLALATTLQSSVVKNVEAADLGVRRARLSELQDVHLPAVVCKLGYLSNKEEARKLADRDYQVKLAGSLVQGVERYAAFLRTGMDERSQEDRQRPLLFGKVEVERNGGLTEVQAEKINVRLDVKAAEHAVIDASRVEVQVYLFESVNGAELDLSTADPPSVSWVSVLPDWKELDTEIVEVKYERPPFTTAEIKEYGKRTYYGYVARLIYDGRVMDEVSYPANLNRCLYYFTPVFPKR